MNFSTYIDSMISATLKYRIQHALLENFTVFGGNTIKQALSFVSGKIGPVLGVIKAFI
jgi:hypothetical protein